MMTPEAAMIFAAGFGTRMGELTKSRPKPLIPVAGRALIDHMLDLLEAVQPVRTVVNTHYLADQIADHLSGRDIAISHEQPDILDTGGGLKAALPLLAADVVFTANSDIIWSGPNPFTALAQAWQPELMDALLICVPLSNTIGREGGGDFDLTPQNHITRGGPYVFGGIQIIKTHLLESVSDTVFSLNRVWNEIAQTDRLVGLPYDGTWCDVGHPDGLKLAEQVARGTHVQPV
jgi:MurNAc alpha-1-phosphate uridylyltransferase